MVIKKMIKRLIVSAVCSVGVILGVVFDTPHNLTTSKQGLEHIANLEGCRTKAYQCSAGTWTHGLGHTRGVSEGDEVDVNQIAHNFIKDVGTAETAVNKLLTVPVTQSQFDVLVSFVFNLGQYNLKRSTMLKKFNRSDPVGACNEFMRWVYVNGKNCNEKASNCSGIIKRRVIEKNACLNGW